MVIHDYHTTISCDICSSEFTVNGGKNERAMREVARRAGWVRKSGQDICAHCAARWGIKQCSGRKK